MTRDRFDVVVVGAGMAGLSLARHLLLATGRTVLVVDKRAEVPGKDQKVGESLVQLSGYYLSKVLQLEEHLLVDHFLKYNLRFHWPTPGRANRALEDYSVSFIRLGSNIPTFQLDRNRIEEHLLELNTADPRFEFAGGARNLAIELDGDADHRVSFSGRTVACRWVVDASGRAGVLKKQLGLAQESPIRHGSTWCWVDGLVNTERLTARDAAGVRLDPDRRKTGHMPFFLATNHFCAEGMWFWVIPLHGRTSLGLVYDHAVLDPSEVSTARKMLDYAGRQWPALAEDFAARVIVDEGRYHSYAYDAAQTISTARWAMTGESGRFSDPLYSPGNDLITIYNTVIVDAIQSDEAELEAKVPFYEQLMRVMYESYVPSYSISYNCLGDQEAFALKYAWELAVYFGFYVVPGINDMFTDRRKMMTHLRKYGLLGPINKSLQMFLSDWARWKKQNGIRQQDRVLVDFYQMCPLRESEKLFYQVGLSTEESDSVFEAHFDRLKEFARYIIAHVYASVLGDRGVLTNAPFVASLKLRRASFDAERMRADYAPYSAAEERYQWRLDPFALADFIPAAKPMPEEVPA